MKITFEEFVQLNEDYVHARYEIRQGLISQEEFIDIADQIDEFEVDPWLDRLQDALEYAIFKEDEELLLQARLDFFPYYTEKITKTFE